MKSSRRSFIAGLPAAYFLSSKQEYAATAALPTGSGYGGTEHAVSSTRIGNLYYQAPNGEIDLRTVPRAPVTRTRTYLCNDRTSRTCRSLFGQGEMRGYGEGIPGTKICRHSGVHHASGGGWKPKINPTPVQHPPPVPAVFVLSRIHQNSSPGERSGAGSGHWRCPAVAPDLSTLRASCYTKLYSVA